MEEEVFDLANQQIQLAITNALKDFTPSNRSRSSSSHRTARRVSFSNILPRCSVPATKHDLIQYQLSLLSYQTRFPNSSNCNHRIFDVQYSFSLNQPWLIKIDQQQQNLRSIKHFAEEFVEHSIHTAFLQIEHGNRTALNSYIDQFLHSTVEQALETISPSPIELYSHRMTEDIITDALSIIAHDKKSNPILSIPRSNEKSLDILVNNLAQQISIHSFNQLRSIFTLDDNDQ